MLCTPVCSVGMQARVSPSLPSINYRSYRVYTSPVTYASHDSSIVRPVCCRLRKKLQAQLDIETSWYCHPPNYFYKVPHQLACRHIDLTLVLPADFKITSSKSKWIIFQFSSQRIFSRSAYLPVLRRSSLSCPLC